MSETFRGRGSSLPHQRLVDQPPSGFLSGMLRIGLILNPQVQGAELDRVKPPRWWLVTLCVAISSCTARVRRVTLGRRREDEYSKLWELSLLLRIDEQFIVPELPQRHRANGGSSGGSDK